MENNIEAILIKYFNDNLPEGWEAFADIPDVKPDQYVQVERTGGPVGSVRIEVPEVIVSFYHKTSAVEASKVALDMDIKMRAEIIRHNAVSKAERLSLVRLDDLVTKYRRYQAYYSFVCLI